MEQLHTQSSTDFRNIFTAGLVAGLLAVLLNNFYSYLYTAATGFRLPELIHVGSITLASFFSCLLGAIVYYVLSKFTRHPKVTFMAIGSIFTLVSFLGPLSATMPDGSPIPAGFAGLALPMHLITGASAILVIPYFTMTHDQN